MASFLISAEELHGLDKDRRVIFDCRFSLADHSAGEKYYQHGHIPGAFRLDMETDLSGPKEQHGGRHPLPAPEIFAKTMRRFGVSDNTLVVAYDDNRFAGASRLWWLLRYFGHSQVRVLDGGLAGWQAAGFEMTNDVSIPVVGPGNFHATPDHTAVVDYRSVQENLNSDAVTLIDSREAPRYRGEEEPIDPVAGHIPGALNSPWQQVTKHHGFAETLAVQQQLWADLPQSDRYVVYCGSGVTACVNLLSMAIAGIENTQLYAGSWSDWCSYSGDSILN